MVIMLLLILLLKFLSVWWRFFAVAPYLIVLWLGSRLIQNVA